ncbi:hypothetical protein PMI14_03561 [Acidovorax sp. CF316]|uniref:hypothetical protein n=1 Tax=Acidovorax sp. CF316 TaxID=1144317 RepID=UPI00026BCFB4|nr:hypothetical protein [Acidovorax sp. CF316]EJE51765.1 hypothetical protein PMI14_03561 [Acidovorax sp. CF316]
MTDAQPAPQTTTAPSHQQAASACLAAWLATVVADIQYESNRPNPDTAKMERLVAERSKLFQERTALEANDKGAIARVVADYAAALQARRFKA